MSGLILNQEKIGDRDAFIRLCPFNALEIAEGQVQVNAACRLCGLCIKKGPPGAALRAEEKKKSIDKSTWSGLAVYVEYSDGEIHPVTLELLGKARELADKAGQKVNCLFAGFGIEKCAGELLHYGADTVYVYDRKELEHFRIDAYTAVFEDFIHKVRPASILIGGTAAGRHLAPRVAARFKTGLTADCTVLDIHENTDLIQIRPAFGGNIMAHIETPNARPQMATVRYKVMNAPQRSSQPSGKLVFPELSSEALLSSIEILGSVPKPRERFIENAEVLVVAGKGVRSASDLKLIEELAELLGGETACTRPLIESGWFDPKRQIGLSGRTVRPKLIIACGVSGSVQFAAGMSQSEVIFAVNKDEKAPIFKLAHYGIVGDLYEVLPLMMAKAKAFKNGGEVLFNGI